jgi:PTH1 family peptidyl-tRNA hydrolase
VLFRTSSRLDGYRGPRAFSWARVDEFDALLVKPETYMNRSGDVVAPLARFAAGEGEPLDPARILVVYDDLDLELGRLRIRPHGGSGGQRGMKSIIDRLETDGFPRLRVGIGRPGTDAARHVLEPFSDQERADAEISIVEASEAVLAWLATDDLQECMTRFHSRWNQDS